ncbi:MAG TPA: N-acetylmuramoyl-L-alanine amidase, partial [Alphaproteobacteria bacterium]|nr:N-acetylmuramoyl-L-alanine amidase [Alphaproteobacteria bacterium]
MNCSTRSCRWTIALATLAALALAPLDLHARTVAEKKKAARAQFEVAERMRAELNSQPESARSRNDYQRVLDAYRKVYHTAPTSNRADDSAFAVAELLAEQGRVLEDPKSFKDAIGQLQFLRREYPGSKHRVAALFTIAEIYRNDLDDAEQAKAVFEDYLKHYPQSRMAPDAKKALAELSAPAKEEKPKARVAAVKKKALPAKSKNTPVETAVKETPEQSEPAATVKEVVRQEAPKDDRHRPALLTSIRHWSTPDYTRVVIDLEQEVQYEAGRVPHPDRIFFDLHGTKLAPELSGKSFGVDGGFLHKIRVAQYKPNLARVVFEVDEVAEYSAFLLPNPYRLIIDIHGKTPVNQSVAKGAKDDRQPEKAPDTEIAADSTRTIAPGRPSATSTAKSDLKASAQKSAPRNSAAAKTESAKAEPPKIIVDDNQPPAATKTSSSDAKVADTKADDAKIEAASKDTTQPTTGPTFQSVAPHRASKRKPATSVTHVAAPTANGDRSLIRALGLKIGKIVVDAGHGGHDTGTIGPGGLEEKDLVLDVALKLGKMLEEKLGAEVVYTRDDDNFVPLETRTAIANKEQADLFISIHANSSDDPSARGIETYYLNFTSSRDALEVAARENSVSEKSIHELQELVKKIALKEKIEESREFAANVQRSLYTGLNAKNPGLRNRGVKKAPFIVLIGANMPSILAEISFVSNPSDEKKLRTSAYRQRIADSLYKGIAKYISGLSGVKV